MKRKTHEGWTSVLVSTPCIPTDILRSTAREAGVHIYSDSGDALYANGSFLAIHVGKEGGSRTFSLPRPARVTELFGNQVVSEQSVEQFTENLPPMATRLYHLAEPGEPAKTATQ